MCSCRTDPNHDAYTCKCSCHYAQRKQCPGEVECSELQTFMPCALGAGHLRPCTPDVKRRDDLRVASLKRFRRALETIADEEKSECGCESIGSHACDVRTIAREALNAS